MDGSNAGFEVACTRIDMKPFVSMEAGLPRELQ